MGASGVSNITAKEQMPTHTPHSSQLENFVERILKVSFSLGLTVLSWNRNQEGVLLEGWGKEAGPEESEGEDRNSLWFASSRPLPGWRWWLLPLIKALWPSSTGSAGRRRTSRFQLCFMEHPLQYTTTLFLAVFLVQAVFFPQHSGSSLPQPQPYRIFSVKKER